MRLKKVILHNIRSYTHEEVNFPDGSVLLSGDIGSGKSSLLLAVEFAIFGIMRGQLEGNALLRHGVNDGYVTLHCEINNQEIEIQRKLKRTPRGTTQDTGYIIIDGVEQQATASELKSKMLDLMGYPSDLLTKNKSLIFRYTVYTPQEHMKHILFEDADERLNTLRKVFDIDRYKRIKENTQTYARTLRDKKKRLEGQLDGYEKKVQQYDLLKSQVKEANQNIEKLEPQVEIIQKELIEKQQFMRTIESKVKQLFECKKQLQVLETTIKYELQRKMDLDVELKRESIQLEALQEEFKDKKIPDHATLTQSIRDTEKRITQIQNERELASRQISEFGVHISNATSIKHNLTKLSACPVCLQQVGDSHKHDVVQEQDKKIKDFIQQQTVLQTKAVCGFVQNNKVLGVDC